MKASAQRRPLREIVDPSWAQALATVEPTIAQLGDFLRRERDAGYTTLPPGRQILRAFQTPLDAVRVLILGQDPYPTVGHPIGLSFAVAAEVRPLPRSLVNIFRELVDDIGVEMPTSGDLTPWTEQGVMLLNRCLTVRAGSPGSHHGRGWEQVTSCAIDALARRGGPLVAILWGRHARGLASALRSVPLIESAHPSPLSARQGFFGSRPFSAANAALRVQGAEPIDWRLP